MSYLRTILRTIILFEWQIQIIMNTIIVYIIYNIFTLYA